LGPDLVITDKAVNMFYEPDMVDGLQKTEGAIGYFSLGHGLSEDIPVNYLELDGVEASLENIASGAYKMVRPLGFVVARPVRDPVAGFVDWAESPEARELITQAGFAPPLDGQAE
jgi:phosphate transport system substrate-binding protein